MEALAILISLFFFIQIRWLYQGGKIDQIKWDMATITAGDFTVDWTIDRQTYQAWDEVRSLFGSQRDNTTGEALLFKQ